MGGSYDDDDDDYYGGEFPCGSSPCTWTLCIELECRLARGCENDHEDGCVIDCDCRNLVFSLYRHTWSDDDMWPWEMTVSKCDVCNAPTTAELLRVAGTGGNLT